MFKWLRDILRKNEEKPWERGRLQPIGTIRKKDEINVYIINFKEAFLDIAKNGEISHNDLLEYMPDSIVSLLERQSIIEYSKDVEQERRGRTTIVYIEPNKTHYVLTLNGAELTNRIEDKIVKVYIKRSVTESSPPQHIPTSQDRKVKCLGFGVLEILPNPELEELLGVKL